MLWLLKKLFHRPNDKIHIKGKVIAILRNREGKIKKVITGNIVTTDGEAYYAQMSAGESTSNSYSYLRLGSDTTPPSKSDTDVVSFLSGTAKQVSAGYPKTNDSDPNNSGAGANIVTWKFFYDTNEANYSNINEGAIVNDANNPTSALCRFVFTSTISKTSAETLTIYVNHTYTGV